MSNRLSHTSHVFDFLSQNGPSCYIASAEQSFRVGETKARVLGAISLTPIPVVFLGRTRGPPDHRLSGHIPCLTTFVRLSKLCGTFIEIIEQFSW